MFLAARPIYDLARPGYALYGGNPTPGRAQPDASGGDATRSAIQQTRWVEPGATCGYNAEWTAKAPRRGSRPCSRAMPTACCAAPARPTQGRAQKSSSPAGRCAPWDKTSMDLTIVDVTDLPEDRRSGPASSAEFFGAAAGLDDFAAQSGTIGYQVLTGLGPRYRRRKYVG